MMHPSIAYAIRVQRERGGGFYQIGSILPSPPILPPGRQRFRLASTFAAASISLQLVQVSCCGPFWREVSWGQFLGKGLENQGLCAHNSNMHVPAPLLLASYTQWVGIYFYLTLDHRNGGSKTATRGRRA